MRLMDLHPSDVLLTSPPVPVELVNNADVRMESQIIHESLKSILILHLYTDQAGKTQAEASLSHHRRINCNTCDATT